MNVLVIGSGGRENAIAWKLAGCKKADRIFVAPGNPGTALLAENVAISPDDVEGLKEFALRQNIGLTIVGPELPLTLGIADIFEEAGLKVFGPSRAAAELEGSKVFCKWLMRRYGIPTALYEKFDDPALARAYVESREPPYVVKADGLAAGKGVMICGTKKEALEAIGLMMERKAFGAAGGKVVIEEFLEGEEASYLAVTDGKTVIPLATAQDHKAIYDNDEGPNTGGMGAYSPAPVITAELEKEILDTIMKPVVRAMEKEGRPYRGVLYAGLMIHGGKPRVLEFNCRLGDPETQPILMRLESDLLELFEAAAEGRLEGVRLKWSRNPAVCVVMSAKGYPGEYAKGDPIKGVEAAGKINGVTVFQAGTAIKEGKLVTSGGRVLGVTAIGEDIKDAIERAYSAAGLISWDGAYYRKDIGAKALKRKH